MTSLPKVDLDRLFKIIFVFSIVILAYVFGVISNWYKIFPYHILHRAHLQITNYLKEEVPHHLYPIRYQKTGVTINKQNETAHGVTLLTSYWNETNGKPGIRLIDLNGEILHHWEVLPSKIWPESPHSDFTKNKKNTDANFIHGTYLYPNGDIVFNIEYLGLVKMNSKGEILWKLDYRTHHSVFIDEDGYIWVSGAKWIEKGHEREALFNGVAVPFTEETILKITPEGKIVLEISLLESLVNANYEHLFHHYKRLKYDLLHLNDVEILSKNQASDFPIFDQGDIVISSRGLCLIAVLNQDGKIKWINTGDFTEQHDPDFEENGWITIFDNRMGLGQSKIKKINPVNNEVLTIFPTDDDVEFYTATGGKHQKLENGNRLITEARAGRIFEINESGEIVWEWIQEPYNTNYVPEVLEGTRYYYDPKIVDSWAKPETFNY